MDRHSRSRCENNTIRYKNINIHIDFEHKIHAIENFESISLELKDIACAALPKLQADLEDEKNDFRRYHQQVCSKY